MAMAIIQARLGSIRFPGKVLRELHGNSLISYVINRLQYCKRIDDVIVATTVNPRDDALVAWCEKNHVKHFRGDENNVLKRYFDAATKFHANVIVRVTSDDPFKEPAVIDDVIAMLESENLDFAYNNFPPSFPEGLDTEVFTYEALKKAVYAETTDFEKEHVTQYFYHNPHIFKCKNLPYERDVSKIRLTVDTDKDFELAEAIYERLSPNGEMFCLEDILALFDAEPDLLNMNKGVKRSAMYEK